MSSSGDLFADAAPAAAPDACRLLRAAWDYPPQTILNAREGWWQARKRLWLSLGIKSELGRGDLLTYTDEAVAEPGLNYYRRRKGAAADV